MDFSVCMIMKNEENVLGKCLSSLKDFNIPTSNIIIVDTGSTDSSVEVAKSFGITPYDHKWNNDFSEARNIRCCLKFGRYCPKIRRNRKHAQKPRAFLETMPKSKAVK